MDEAAKREIGLRIGEARNLKNLTQDELSDILNVTLRTIQNWEAGDVPLKRLEEISEAVGKPKAWLIHGGVAPADDPFVQRINELQMVLDDAHLDELRGAIRLLDHKLNGIVALLVGDVSETQASRLLLDAQRRAKEWEERRDESA